MRCTRRNRIRCGGDRKMRNEDDGLLLGDAAYGGLVGDVVRSGDGYVVSMVVGVEG